MSDRYFVAEPVRGDRAILTGAEAHHLGHVMRARVGQEVLLLDGSGAEMTARVERIDRSSVELIITSSVMANRELPRRITLAVALPKGDRQRWLVEKATELGVARLVPLITERSVARLSASALERLRRAVIEASKQCGRTRLMEIAEPQVVEQLVTASQGTYLFAHPGRSPLTEVMREHDQQKVDELTFAVGPEGGLTDHEVALFDGGQWKGVDLGPRILRVETAAVLLAAAGAILAAPNLSDRG